MTAPRMILAALGLAALGAGSSASAQTADCPVGIARDGVYLTFPDRIVLSRVLSDGRIFETEMALDGSYLYDFIVHPIGLVAESWSRENGLINPDDWEIVTYQGTPAEIPMPAAGLSWNGLETARFQSGDEARYAVSLTIGQPEEIAIGPCRYSGLPVLATRTAMSDGFIQRDAMMAVPELGIVIYQGYAEGSEPIGRDVPSAIGLRPPVRGAAAAPPQGNDAPPPPALPVPAPPAPAAPQPEK